MFLNISSDQIMCLTEWNTHILPYLNIERTFWPWLDDLLTTYNPTKLYVLNGPWSFTTLRVCCLAINLLQQHHAFTILTTSKPDLFHRLYTTSNFPRHIGITIWQKKNLRIYDTETKQEEKSTFSDRQQHESLLIDHILDPTLIWGDEFSHRILHFFEHEEQLMIGTVHETRSIDFSASCRQEVTVLTPNYLIDPTMG